MEGKEITELDDVTLSEETQVIVCNPDDGAGKTTLKDIQTATASKISSVSASTVLIDQGSDPSISVQDTTSGTLNQNHSFAFDFKLPKMQSILSIDQTQTSSASSAENQATITMTDGSTSTLSFYNGAKGEKGDDGAKGESGVTVPTAGIFEVYISDEGHLILKTAETTETASPLSIDDDGHLIYTVS